MKLTALFVLLFCLSAAGNVRAQVIELDIKDAPLERVLNELQRQSGYSFIYNAGYLENAQPVSIRIRTGDIEKVLRAVFADQPFEYRISEKVITIVRKPELNGPGKVPPKQSAVRGRVTDSLGSPLQGVTVQITGTNFHTSTDNNGLYEFRAVPFGAILSFRLLSYEPYEVPVDRQIINVSLRLQYSVLDETEVRGYYNTTKKLSTGNARTITAREISSQPVTNPLLTLQGRVAGLAITQSMGTPGKNISVAIRGRNSIANGNDPLYIIDGVPFASTSLMGGQYIASSTATGSQNPLNSINAEDIESITVLKDADATAIYGSMGANGVILITTKKGNENGRVSVNADFYTGFGGVTGKLNLMNTAQYLEMRRESFENSGVQPRPVDYDINGTWDPARYTDWQEVLLGNTARVSNSQLRFSGGNSQTQFTLGGGYNKETTVYPGKYYDQRLSLQSSFNHRSNDDKFTLAFSASYSNNRNQMPVVELAQNITLPPNAPALFDVNGDLNWENETWINPFAALNSKNIAVTDNYLGNGTIGYTLFRNLNLKVAFGANRIGMKQDVMIPGTASAPSQNKQLVRSHNLLNNQRQSWIVEPQATYQIKLGSGLLESLIGTTFRENRQTITGINARNFANDDLIKNIAAAGEQNVDYFDQIQYRYHAVYGRIGYNWKEKYILNLTGRRDGSSRFGPGKQFGSFGAVGGAWVLSEEEFMKHFPVLNFAKIRGSFGITGNDQLTDYEYLSSYSIVDYTYLNSIGLIPSRLSNPNYGWESVRKTEVGLELGLLDNQLQLITSWYSNRTGNQLVGYPLPNLTGFNSIRANMSAIVQNRGLEVEVTVQPKFRGAIQWNAGGNISFPSNKLVSYPDFESSNYRTTYKVGQSMYGDYRYPFKEVDPVSGVFTFEDTNGDGSISSADRIYIEREQAYFGGLTNNLSFYDFSLSIHLQFVKQTKPRYYIPPAFGLVNQPADIMDRWQNEGDKGNFHQMLTRSFSNNLNYFMSSDALLVNASYVRLKNVSMSYQVSDSVMKFLNIHGLQLYVEGQNLLTFTKYGDADPETIVGTYVPPIRMFTTGIKLIL